MKVLSKQDLDNLQALSSDTLEVIATSAQITMRLKKVVALTNFKTLAATGRSGNGASFDGSSKTLTLPLINKQDFVPGKLWLGFPGDASSKLVDSYTAHGNTLQLSDEAYAGMIALCVHELDKLMKLAVRLGGNKAKAFTNTREATKARKPITRSSKSNPSDMDMPMYDQDVNEWYDGEIESRPGGVMRDHHRRPNMASYGRE